MPEETDELLKVFKNKISELEDLELVNKLDIINIKNELDKISLTNVSSPEVEERVSELKRLADKVGDIKKYDRLLSDIDRMKSVAGARGGADDLKARMDELGRRVEDLSKQRAGAPGASLDYQKLAKDLSSLRSSFQEMKGRAEPAAGAEDRLKALEKRIAGLGSPAAGGRDALEKRVAALESARPQAAPSGGDRKRLEALEERLSQAEKAGQGRIPADQQEQLARLRKDINAEIASIRVALGQLGSRPNVSGAARPAPAIPAVLLSRIEKLEKARKPGAMPQPGQLKALERRLTAEIEAMRLSMPSGPTGAKGKHASLAAPSLAIAKRIAALEGAVSALKGLKAGVRTGSSGLGRLEDKVERLASKLAETKAEAAGLGPLSDDFSIMKEKLGGVERSLGELAKAPRAKPEDVAELQKEFNVMKAMMSGFPSEKQVSAQFSGIIQDLKAQLGRIDSLSRDISAVRAKSDAQGSEMDALKIAPHVLEELRTLQKEFPTGDFMKMRDRMESLEEKLEKAGRIADALKPISLPGEEASKAVRSLEMRLDSVEKSIGTGIGPQKFKDLEDKVNEIKVNLPPRMWKATGKQLSQLEEKIDAKVREVEDLKREVVESAVEQLLAQPAAAGKFVEQRSAKQVSDLESRIRKLEAYASSLDSKATSAVRETGERDREMDRIRMALKEADVRTKKDLESMEIEVKAMAARLGTASTSLKQMEGTGVTGVTRDIEILKTKLEWLESTMQKFELRPLMDKVDELEEKIRTAGRAQPFVIE